MKFGTFSALVAFVVSLPVCGAVAQLSNGLAAVRVYAIQPSCFEFMFTSTMDNPGGKPILTFNHINGRTVFAGVGDPVLDYTVKSFDSADEMVFNPTVNSYVEKKAGVVTLQSVAGRRYLLELGKILPQPGWLACIVWLDSGNWMYAGDDNAIPAGGGEVPVHAVSQDSVLVMNGSVPQRIPLISDTEKALLVSLWETRRRASEEPAVDVNKPREESEPRVVTQYVRAPLDVESVLNPSRRSIEVRMPPQYFYGADYGYPWSFETLPLMTRTASGTTIRQSMVLPARFPVGRPVRRGFHAGSETNRMSR